MGELNERLRHVAWDVRPTDLDLQRIETVVGLWQYDATSGWREQAREAMRKWEASGPTSLTVALVVEALHDALTAPVPVAAPDEEGRGDE